MQLTIQLHRLPGNDDIELPRRMSAEAAGMDVRAAVTEPVVLAPMQRALIPAGFAMAFPAGWECQVRPRSGLAAKHGITCLNTPGTIDSDYRGEVKVLLINLGSEPFTITRGERIAQLLFAPVPAVTLIEVDELSATVRGTGGFGSSGQQ